MPLTPKGKAIEKAMTKEYGPKKGKSVFYGSKNKGTIKGVEKKSKGKIDMKSWHLRHGDYPDAKPGSDYMGSR